MMNDMEILRNEFEADRNRKIVLKMFFQGHAVVVCGVLIGVCMMGALIMSVCTRWPIAGVWLERSGILLLIAINLVMLGKVINGRIK